MPNYITDHVEISSDGETSDEENYNEEAHSECPFYRLF